MSSCRKRRTSINSMRVFLLCSTSRTRLDCCLRLRLHFPNVEIPLLFWRVTQSSILLHRLLFLCHLRSDTAQPSCLHHPVIHLLVLSHIWSTTSPLQAHRAPFFSSASISPSANLRRVIRKPFVPSLLDHGPINTLRNIVTVNAFVQHLPSSEATYRRPCSGISLTRSIQHYLLSNQDDHPRHLQYCHAYTRSTRHCQTFYRTRHAIALHCSSLPQSFLTKW